MNSVDKYYEERKNLNYYKKILEILSKLKFNSILDVGARRSPVLESIHDSSIEKVLIDIEEIPVTQGIRNIQTNFYKWVPDKKYDIVACFQVLEHLDDPETFAKKLFTIANEKVLISVPYKWKKGQCKYHVQDPVDEHKLKRWTNKDPIESYVINDKVDRLICVYNAN